MKIEEQETECVVKIKRNEDGSQSLILEFDPPIDAKSETGQFIMQEIKEMLMHISMRELEEDEEDED